MLIFKLAWASVKKTPSRTVMTFLSVMMSSALLTIVCCFVSSMINEFDPKDPDYAAYAMTFLSLVIIVAVVSAVLIRAMFAIAFNEKVNVLGLLATVGMTNGGKAALIAVETAFYAVAGGLSGTLIGKYVSVLHIDYMNHGMYKYYKDVLNANISNTVFYEYHAPFWVLLSAFLLTVAVTALAAYKPIKRLSRLSVINSLKADVSINVSLHEGLFEKIMCRFFGRIGRLAGQNFDNNAPRYRAVSLTLPCAQILFVSIYALFMWDFWEEGIYNAYDNPQFTSGILIGYILTAIALLGALGSAIVNINGRTREFAALKSMGMSNRDIFKLMCSESIFIMFHAVAFGLIGSYLSVLAQYLFLWTSNTVQWFHFPWREWLVFIGIDAAFCLIFAVYATLKIRKINIAAAMK